MADTTYYEVYVDGAVLAPSDSNKRDPHTRVRELIRIAGDLLNGLSVIHHGPGELVILGISSDDDVIPFLSQLNAILPEPTQRWKSMTGSVGAAFATKFIQAGEVYDSDIDEPIEYIGLQTDLDEQEDSTDDLSLIVMKYGEFYREIDGSIRLSFCEDMNLLRITILDVSDDHIFLYDQAEKQYIPSSQSVVETGTVIYIPVSSVVFAE